jgi:hypothetical protein
VRPLLWFCLTKCVTPLRVKKERRFVCSCTSLASHLSEHFVIESTYNLQRHATVKKNKGTVHTPKIGVCLPYPHFFILGKNKIKAHYCSTCCLFYFNFFNFCFTIIILCETIYNDFIFQVSTPSTLFSLSSTYSFNTYLTFTFSNDFYSTHYSLFYILI